MNTPNEATSTTAAAKQDGSSPASPEESAIPSNINRRSFIMRNAVIGAAAVMNNLSIAQVIMANEIAVSGKTEEQINAFLDKIANAMLATVKAGLAVKEGVLPGPIKLHSKAATVWERAQD